MTDRLEALMSRLCAEVEATSRAHPMVPRRPETFVEVERRAVSDVISAFTAPPIDLPAAVDVVLASHPFGRASAAKRGRNPNWPWVPVVDYGEQAIGPNATRTKQIPGRAYATRDEAVACAERCISRAREHMRARFLDPCCRALREQYGLPREIEKTLEPSRPESSGDRFDALAALGIDVWGREELAQAAQHHLCMGWDVERSAQVLRGRIEAAQAAE